MTFITDTAPIGAQALDPTLELTIDQHGWQYRAERLERDLKESQELIADLVQREEKALLTAAVWEQANTDSRARAETAETQLTTLTMRYHGLAAHYIRCCQLIASLRRGLNGLTITISRGAARQLQTEALRIEDERRAARIEQAA